MGLLDKKVIKDGEWYDVQFHNLEDLLEGLNKLPPEQQLSAKIICHTSSMGCGGAYWHLICQKIKNQPYIEGGDI